MQAQIEAKVARGECSTQHLIFRVNGIHKIKNSARFFAFSDETEEHNMRMEVLMDAEMSDEDEQMVVDAFLEIEEFERDVLEKEKESHG